MIERYTLPEMGAIWTEEAKMRAWLDVEIAAVKAWNRSCAAGVAHSEYAISLMSGNSVHGMTYCSKNRNNTVSIHLDCGANDDCPYAVYMSSG